MATFVLVHGAWHGSWCWKRVRSALQAQGHEVFTPTLTGVGERSHLLSPDIDLRTHVLDVANLILWEDLTDVVLCGHSYGGCVITGAADLVADRIAALVYLDAFTPGHGESLHDLLPPEQRQMQLDGSRELGEGWKTPPIPAAVFKVNAADRDWVDAQCGMQPTATFTQKQSLTGAADKIADVTYILADWEGSPFPACRDRAARRGWNTLEVACGHDVMLDDPQTLTAMLSEVGERVARA